MGGMKELLGDDLFSWPQTRARMSDPQTSHAAARSINVTKMERLVLDSLRIAGAATSHELADRMNISLVTISPRLRPLSEKGLIEDSGEKRKGDSGRFGIVWQATAAGRLLS